MAGQANGDIAVIDGLVAHYEKHFESFQRLGRSIFDLTQDSRLISKIHSARWRTKGKPNLVDKLQRKMAEARKKGVDFDITSENLFERINDLVGVRILHLHTDQFESIHEVLKTLLEEEGFAITEGPCARIWDSEYKKVFEGFGVSTEENPRMYTSVHYVVSPKGREARTAEIQVRTLAEEIWGEVDHSVNYPHQTSELSLKEQIRVLARVTSSCTRLVDSIFRCRKNG